MGARSSRVETPGIGDESRHWAPPFVGPEDDSVSTYFLSANRTKESLQLDLKSEEGRTAPLSVRRRREVGSPHERSLQLAPSRRARRAGLRGTAPSRRQRPNGPGRRDGTEP
jgi:hypothetical protein